MNSLTGNIPRPRVFSGLANRFAMSAGLVALAVLAACTAAAPEPAPLPAPTVPPVVAVSSHPAPDSTPTNPMTGASPGKIEPILATTVLNPGEQRVAFLLVGEKAIIKAPQATVSAVYLGRPRAAGAPTAAVTALYHDWPYGIRGSYSTQLAFDRPGPWQLNVAVADGELVGSAVIDLEVTAASPVPAIGARPPLSQTKVLAEVAGIEKLTTDYHADEDLYRITVAEAIASPRPAVVVFASPAFCTSPTCGPQVDTVKELKAAYQDRVDFVHVEIYDRPDEIQGDLSRAEFASAVDEWGFSSLPHWFNESWVFIINPQGTVDQRFEGYAALAELEAALKQTLGES